MAKNEKKLEVKENTAKKKEEKVNQLYINLSKVQKIYQANQLSNSESIFLGTIKIPEINLEYMIFNNFDEDLLKISICKFSGKDLIFDFKIFIPLKSLVFKTSLTYKSAKIGNEFGRDINFFNSLCAW